jgi:hypothetical protein
MDSKKDSNLDLTEVVCACGGDAHLVQDTEQWQPFFKTSVIGCFQKRHEFVEQISDGYPIKNKLSLLRIGF